jgi:hypothetical protein
MGAAVAACLGSGVIWAPEGRSAATAERARDLAPGDPLTADVILSICPPHAAREVARSVQAFTGVYVDANAVSPATSREIRALVPDADFVDGGIIGPPPTFEGSTRLYLSGDKASYVAALFADTILDARVVSDASALKMAYAAWTKGSAALIIAAHRLAEELGVDAELDEEWRHADLTERHAAALRAAEDKGWRWVGEMEEIAATFAAVGQPDGFHRAAAEVYRG